MYTYTTSLSRIDAWHGATRIRPKKSRTLRYFFFQRHVTDTHLSSCDLHTKIPKMLRTPPHQLIYLTNTSKSHTGIPCPVAMSLNRILPRIHTIHISNSPECSWTTMDMDGRCKVLMLRLLSARQWPCPRSSARNPVRMLAICLYSPVDVWVRGALSHQGLRVWSFDSNGIPSPPRWQRISSVHISNFAAGVSYHRSFLFSPLDSWVCICRVQVTISQLYSRSNTVTDLSLLRHHFGIGG